MSNKQKLMLISIFSLLLVNWLSFRTTMKLNSMSDWALVLGTISTFMYFVDDLGKQKKAK